MAHTYWRRQANDEPLFEDILWSRPESKSQAGKLAVIGGNGHGFQEPGIAWSTALEQGIGVCNVLLPNAIQKLVGRVLPDAEFAPSTPSGSFSKKSLDELLRISNWSDATILAGALGRNRETAVVIEDFVDKYQGLLTVTHDAVDYFSEIPKKIVDRENTLIVLSLSQLQKLFIATPSITPITYSMSTVQLVEALHEYTKEHQSLLMTKHHDLAFIGYDGEVITPPLSDEVWRVKTATKATVFWLQNPSKIIESAATSLLNINS